MVFFLAVERREEGSTESGRGTWVAGRVVFFQVGLRDIFERKESEGKEGSIVWSRDL